MPISDFTVGYGRQKSAGKKIGYTNHTPKLNTAMNLLKINKIDDGLLLIAPTAVEAIQIMPHDRSGTLVFK